MKRKGAFLGFTAVLLSSILMIIFLPYLVFGIQESGYLNIVRYINIPKIGVEVSGQEMKMSLNDKLLLLEAQEGEIKEVELKMGEVFSLYEARKRCFQELCKLPSLEMDVYGPIKDEIDILPKLYIDTETPSKSLIVWNGTFVIKENTYQITLDEESRKIIQLQIMDASSPNGLLQEQLEKEWTEYLDQKDGQ